MSQPFDAPKSQAIAVSEWIELDIEAVAGQVRVSPQKFFGGARVSIDGAELPRSWGRFTLPLKAGGTTTGRFTQGLRDTVAPFTVDGTSYPLGPQMPVWLAVVAILPLGLIGIGGMAGALAGALAWTLNRKIATQDLPLPVQAAAMVAMGVSALVVYVGVAVLVFGI